MIICKTSMSPKSWAEIGYTANVFTHHWPKFHSFLCIILFIHWILYVLITWNLLFLILVFHLQKAFAKQKIISFSQQSPVIIFDICCNNGLIFVCMKFSRNNNHILCIWIMKAFLKLPFNLVVDRLLLVYQIYLSKYFS